MTKRTTFYIKQGDRSPSIVELLKNGDGSPIDLTGASVRFRMSRGNGTVIVDAVANIDDEATGQVSYDWADGDTDLVGTFFREWQVTLPSGLPVTVPSDRFGYEVSISAQLA